MSFIRTLSICLSLVLLLLTGCNTAAQKKGESRRTLLPRHTVMRETKKEATEKSAERPAPLKSTTERETEAALSETSKKTEPSESSTAEPRAAGTAEEASEATEATEDAEPTEETEAEEETEATDTVSTISPDLCPPESEPKDDAYFADSLFIGDSRIEGLMLYGTLYDADFIYGKGFNIGEYFRKDLGINGGGTAAALIDRNRGRYGEVYIAFGINETGWPLDSFISHYEDVVRDIMEKQPQANIYVQAILPVAHSQDGNAYVNNEVIGQFNRRIEDLAQTLGVYFLDPSEAVAAADGSLPEDAATDGIHFGRAYTLKWQDYIARHVVPRKS